MKLSSVEKATTIYQLYLDGLSTKQISQKLSISLGTVNSTVSYMKKAVNGGKKLSRCFRIAAQSFIKKQETHKQQAEESAINLIENAKRDLDAAIVSFIDEQVKKSVEEVRLENETLKQQLKEQQEIIDAAKHSNLYHNLRKHFGIQA